MVKTSNSSTNGPVTPPTTSNINPDSYNEALFFIQDLLDRSLIEFMVLKDLAKFMVNERHGWDQRPDKLTSVDLGIKKNSLNEFGYSTLKTMFETYHDYITNLQWNNDFIRFNYKDVPVFIRIINRNYKFFQNPDSVFYRVETFKIPNPFDGYWLARFIIK